MPRKKDDFEMIQEGGHKKIVAGFSRCKNKHGNNDVNQRSANGWRF